LSLSFWLSHRNHAKILLPHTCCMPCLSHPPQLDYSNYIWQLVQVMKSLIMQFPPGSRPFIRLGSKCSSQNKVVKRIYV
jgi:hypothetical protein